jgi:AraC-like DNA-binding protein
MLEHFWGSGVTRRLADRLAEAETPARTADLLEDAMIERLPGVGEPDPALLAIVRTVTRERPPGVAIGRLLSELGLSERSLRRYCHDAFGYGPKMLERILRFQKFLRLLRRSSAPRLSRLAAEAGYADQAHLTREVRRLSGLTPRSFLTADGRLQRGDQV